MNILEVYDKLQIGTNSRMNINFVGRGNVWINNTYDSSVIRLARQIIFEAIHNTAPGQLSIIGYDSDLSGVLAPFSTLSSGETKLLEIITEEKGFREYLEHIRQQIQAVQNVIQGRNDSLIEFRESIMRPVEGYRLVVLSMDIGLMEQEDRAKLALLMRSGPACGISFLIISTTYMSIQTTSGRDIELTVDSIAQNITVLEVFGNTVTVKNDDQVAYSALPVETIIQRCELFAEEFRNAQLPTVNFTELHDMQQIWSENSVDGVSFSIGKYGINNMTITIGDEVNQRHNAIITGAVGQGKSNLISVIIHSLCQRYSPWELQMYLLDFKEGVTFKPFSNIGQEEFLPHAKALGLESDVEFGIAVLRSLYREYEKRMKQLKEFNSKSIRELRKNNPEMELPRIVVVIDEFQMMFGDDMQKGLQVAELLEKSVRLFRAAGIHFILASQTLCGNMALSQKKDSIFSQIPVRIALKNSISESQQTLSMNNSAAAFLRPREAIVNLDYGEVSQNRKTVVAFADENVLAPIRRSWWEMSRTRVQAPCVFESEKRISISNSLDRIRRLRREGRSPVAIVGDKISIDSEYMELPLSEEPGRNIAIIGTPDGDCNQAVGIIQSIAVSLALQNAKGNARFIICDFVNREAKYDEAYPFFVQIMEHAGYFIEQIAPEDFEDTIRELYESGRSEDSVYVFGVALDRWEYEKDPFGQGSVLKQYVETGPSKNMHFIGWWIKASSYTEQVAGIGGSDAFNSKIFLRIDERAIQSLTSPFVKWSAHDNRALISDAIEFAEEITFIPYSPITQNDLNSTRTMMWE